MAAKVASQFGGDLRSPQFQRADVRGAKRVRVSNDFTWNPTASIQFARKDGTTHNDYRWDSSSGIRFSFGRTPSRSEGPDALENNVMPMSSGMVSNATPLFDVTNSQTPVEHTFTEVKTSALSRRAAHTSCTSIEKVHSLLSPRTGNSKWHTRATRQPPEHYSQKSMGFTNLEQSRQTITDDGGLSVVPMQPAAKLIRTGTIPLEVQLSVSVHEDTLPNDPRAVKKQNSSKYTIESISKSTLTGTVGTNNSTSSLLQQRRLTHSRPAERITSTYADHNVTRSIQRKSKSNFLSSSNIWPESLNVSFLKCNNTLIRPQLCSTSILSMKPPYLGFSPSGSSGRVSYHSSKPFRAVNSLAPCTDLESSSSSHTSHIGPYEASASSNSSVSSDWLTSDDGSADETIQHTEDDVELGRLMYQIPNDDLHRDLAAYKAGKEIYWNHIKYRGPNGQSPSVRYCTTLQQSEDAAQIFAQEKVIGFDMEWKIGGASIKDHVSVVQIASDSTIAVFHLALFRGDAVDELIGPKLRSLLESPKTLKCGVNIGQDFKRVRKYLGITFQGCFELSLLHNLISLSSNAAKPGRRLVSLTKQVERHLLLPLRKDDVRTSDWSKRLNYDQVTYAAADAYAGFRLFHELEAKRHELSPMPPRPCVIDAMLSAPQANDSKHAVDTAAANALDADGGDTSSERNELTPSASRQTHPFARKDSIEEISAIDNATSNLSRRKWSLPADEDDSEMLGTDVTPERAIVISEDGSRELPMYPDLTSRLQSLGIEEAITVTTQHSEAQAAVTAHLSSADIWIDDWIRGLPEGAKPKSSRRQLQAYTLWHEQAMNVDQIATMLKSPPLSRNTVTNYILDAVRDEELPFNASRLRALLPFLRQNWVQRRYWSVLKRLE
ncbi:MAG: hypothetical protein M1822_002993 [Bathelium mastoideum]|nr:MAG: hypothetical protein M1822_002993 [Bathelium mastoideum]